MVTLAMLLWPWPSLTVSVTRYGASPGKVTCA